MGFLLILVYCNFILILAGTCAHGSGCRYTRAVSYMRSCPPLPLISFQCQTPEVLGQNDFKPAAISKYLLSSAKHLKKLFPTTIISPQKRFEVYAENSNHETVDLQHSLLGVDWHKAISLLEHTEKASGVSPMTVVFNAALNAYERAGNGEMAVNVFNEMLEKKVLPDLITFTAVLSACEKSDMSAEVMRIYESMQDTNLHPDKRIYNIVLSALSKEGDAAQAISLFEHMLKDTYMDQMESNSYAYVISACEKQQRVNEAFRYYNDMRNNSIPLSLYVANCLLSVCEKTGSHQKALSLYKDLKYDYNIAPNINTFNLLLSVFANTHHIAEMERVWKDMEEAYGDVFPNHLTYQHALRGYSNVGDWKKAVKLLNDYLSSGTKHMNPLIFLHVLHACKECGEAQEAVRVLRIMQLHISEISIAAYNLVLSACATSENWELLLSIFSEFRRKVEEKSKGTDISLAYALMAYYHMHRYNEANAIIHELLKKSASLHPLTEKIVIMFQNMTLASNTL